MRRPGRRALVRFLLLVVVPAAAAAAGGHYWVKATRYVVTENAYVKAHHVAVSADVSGRAVRVAVRENARVRRGDLLFELDPEPHRIEMARADAELEEIRIRLAALRAEYRTAEAELRDAEQDIPYYERVFARQRQLSARGASSQARDDEAERNLIRARLAARALERKVAEALARLGGRDDLPVEDHPLYREAMARRERAVLDLRRTRVSAPVAGVVGRMTLQPGEFVSRGKPVIPVIQAGDVWIEANLKETQLAHVSAGQAARVAIDAYPDREWTARVASISPSTGAELSVLPPQNASGNWVKVVQRVPVRLEFDRHLPGLALRAGMTARVSIDTGRERSLVQVVGAALARMVGGE